MGLIVTMAGQDISSFLSEIEQGDNPAQSENRLDLKIASVLGQGPGAGSSGPASATSAEFTLDMGPVNKAIGAGQTPTPTYYKRLIEDGPVALYRLDSERYAPDQSGNGNNGDILQGPLFIVPGDLGDRNPAWQSDGIACVRAPLSITDRINYSVAFRIKLLDDAAHGPVVCIGDEGTGIAFGVGLDNDFTQAGQELCSVDGITEQLVYQLPSMLPTRYTAYHPVSSGPTPTATLPVGEWVCIEVVADSSTITFYVNGSAVATSSVASGLPTGHIYLGTTSGGTKADGIVIDEVAIYATALASTRPAIHYAARDVAPALVRLGEVIVKDDLGSTVFGGYANHFADASLPTVLKTAVTCGDYFANLDTIEVNTVYTGQGDVDIITDIMTTYAPDISLAGLPDANTYFFTKRFVRAKSVKEALQAIANISGYAVWVSPDKVLHYAPLTDVDTAPFSLSSDPDFSSSFGYDMVNYQQDDTAPVNRVYFHGGKQTTPDFTQDLSVQANGVNQDFAFLFYPHEASDGSIHLKLNGVELTIGSSFTAGADGKTLDQGGSKQAIINFDAEVVHVDSSVIPEAADDFIAIYRYNTPMLVVTTDEASHRFYGRYLDGKLDDQSVLDQATAIQRSKVLLAQQNYGLTTAEVTTWQAGLQAGMLLSIHDELRELDQQFLIQQVIATPFGAGQFQYDVTLGAWNWSLADFVYNIARRTGVTDDTTDEDTLTVSPEEEDIADLTVDLELTITGSTSGHYHAGHFHSGFATI